MPGQTNSANGGSGPAPGTQLSFDQGMQLLNTLGPFVVQTVGGIATIVAVDQQGNYVTSGGNTIPGSNVTFQGGGEGYGYSYSGGGNRQSGRTLSLDDPLILLGGGLLLILVLGTQRR
jgi:hypothetical protein